jgi:gamma-glutamylputrescine oxidase
VLAQAMPGEAPVPPELAVFGLEPTCGRLGLAAAQLTYWGLQARDALLDVYHRSQPEH